MLLGAFLASDPGNIDIIVDGFMNGNVQLFTRAGDSIGDLQAESVDIRFLDSCGRAINPSYYLHIIREPRNAAEVTMLTSLAAAPANLSQTHPLDYLLSAAVVRANGGNDDHVLDHTAPTPPKPRLVTIPVQDAAGSTIAGRGVPIGALGEWHESRNQPLQFPWFPAGSVRWRYHGSQASDTDRNDWCKLRSEAKPEMVSLLPGGANFDHAFTPTPDTRYRDKVTAYWDRYSTVFNAVADEFEVPCEILLSIACMETSYENPDFPWFAPADFAGSHEMDVIRMEALKANPNAMSNDAAQHTRLTNYFAIAGGPGAPHATNAFVPTPWSGAAQPPPSVGNPLTWADLCQLINDFPTDDDDRRPGIQVSVGVMQTLVETAARDLAWLQEIYGVQAIQGLFVVHNGVRLVADTPPAGLGALFSDWFGVSVDAAGVNTHLLANVDAVLTKMKRALHSVIAGAAHIKAIYNSVVGVADNARNLVCDFDLPTVASGYNDRAQPVSAEGSLTDEQKWTRLFGLRFWAGYYPERVTRLFNATVTLFNALPANQDQPAVRLWRR